MSYVEEGWCSTDWAGVEPRRYEPISRTPTLEERISEAEVQLVGIVASKRLIHKQISLYVKPGNHPAIFDQDQRHLNMAAIYWGRKLGGLKSARKRQLARDGVEDL